MTVPEPSSRRPASARSGTRAFASLLLCVALPLFGASRPARAQSRTYIGYAYPAGGQQGTTFQVKLGGQGLDDADKIIVTGRGVSVKLIEYHRALNPQEMTLLNEQLRDLKRTKSAAENMMEVTIADEAMMGPSGAATANAAKNPSRLVAKIEKRIADNVNRPASAALAGIVYAEVTIASNAPPGQRELRVITLRGVSNPLVFHVGQVPESTRKAMKTASYQVLGKEELALRKRPTNEMEVRITLPCTLNGQIASGEQNRYRFSARKGQRLVISTLARQLIPFIADAVPGWFQPVLALYDEKGREVAYADDYHFKPDPTIFVDVPKDGEYILAIHDAIFRGREDFVYRVTIGELPFVTSLFPLGGRAGETAAIKASGWNLGSRDIVGPHRSSKPGTYWLASTNSPYISNRLPFEFGTLPERIETEQNNSIASAEKVDLPIVVNGRIALRDDWDLFQFRGRAGETIVAEVHARRLESPLDSILKLTDASGQVLALNDDNEDLGAGANTHHADSYLMAKLPAHGVYYLHLGDTSRSGGEDYGYRLRISGPQPDFALRVVPSSVSLRPGSSATLTIHAIRKDGCTNSIRIGLRDPPAGYSAAPVSISGTQTTARLSVKAAKGATDEPVTLSVAGIARIEGRDVVQIAVPAEDRMQAFLWRHLVPAQELKALAYDPANEPARRRARRRPPTVAVAQATSGNTNSATAAISNSATNTPTNKPKFTKQQVAGRLRQLNLLFEEGLLTDSFYAEKVAECEAFK